MIRAWLAYAALLVPIAVIWLLFDGYLFAMLLFLLLLLPLCSLLAMLFSMRQLRLELSWQDDGCTLMCKCPCRFSLVHICMDIHVEQIFFDQEDVLHHWAFAQEQPLHKLTLPFGKCRIHVDGFTCYDMLGLFHRKRKQQLSGERILYPRWQKTVLSIDEDKWEQAASVNDQQAKQSGMMEDAHEVREYLPGDPIHRIHHKLSYKLHKTMIREFQYMAHTQVRVLLDVSMSAEACIFVLSAMRQLALECLRREDVLTVCWLSDSTMQEMEIHDENSLYQCIDRILSMPKANQMPLAAPTYHCRLGVDGLQWLEEGGHPQ